MSQCVHVFWCLDGISMVLANYHIRNKEKLLSAVNSRLTVASYYMLHSEDWGLLGSTTLQSGFTIPKKKWKCQICFFNIQNFKFCRLYKNFEIQLLKWFWNSSKLTEIQRNNCWVANIEFLKKQNFWWVKRNFFVFDVFLFLGTSRLYWVLKIENHMDDEGVKISSSDKGKTTVKCSLQGEL